MESVGTSITPDILVRECPTRDKVDSRNMPLLDSQSMDNVFITTLDLADFDPVDVEDYINNVSLNGDIFQKSRLRSPRVSFIIE